MGTRDVTFKISANDSASDVFRKVADGFDGIGKSAQRAASAADSSSGVFGKLGGAIGGMATVAGGIIAANIFGKIADGIGSFVTTGLEAVGQAQQLKAAMTSLFTANAMYAQSTEQVTVAVEKSQKEMDAEGTKLASLMSKRELLTAQLQEQKERVRQMTEEWTQEGLATKTAQARQADMERQLAQMNAEISGLTNQTTEYNTVTKTTFKTVMSQAEAMKIAQRETDYLMQAVSKLAVVSPFETQNVEMVAKLGVAAGMSAREAEAFTGSFMDMAAAVGIGSESLDFAADQLLQVKKVGKLTTVDLRQLRRMGIDLEKVLGVEMGMSIDDFNAKAEQTPEIFDELFNAMTRFSQNTFAGTSKAMASSVKGIQSTLSDVFTIGARSFFSPLVDAASPAANAIVGKISDAVLGGSIEKLGQQLASKMKAISNAFGRSFGEGFRMIGYFIGQAWTDIQPQLSALGSQIAGMLSSLWTSTIAPQLTLWAGQFGQWINEAIPQIPGQLNKLTAAISTFLAEQWPGINEKLKEWGAKFWDWAKDAAVVGITKLGELTQAFVGWANSPETQTQLNTLGQQLGTVLLDAVALNSSNQENSSKIGMALIQGITAAVVGIGSALLTAGGQIVAGIFAGIGNAITGGNYQPWTVNQFQQFAAWVGSIDWNQVGAGILIRVLEGFNSLVARVRGEWQTAIGGWKKVITDTKWNEIGKSIITGILKGINENITQVYEVIKQMALNAISTAMTGLDAESPSREFMKIGGYITQGLAIGVDKGSKAYQDALGKVLKLDTTQFGPAQMINTAADDVEKRLDDFGIEASKVKAILTGMKQGLRGAGGAKLAATGTSKQLQDAIMGGINFGAIGIEGGTQGQQVASAVDLFAKSIIKLRTEFPKLAQAAKSANLDKLLAGFGKFAGEATGEADQLNKRIATLQTLLRGGGNSFNVGGQTLDRAGAQSALAGLIGQQDAALPGLGRIRAAQGAMGRIQENRQLLNLLGSNQGMTLPQVAQTAEVAIRTILDKMGPPVTNKSFTLVVNSSAPTESLIQDFALLEQLAQHSAA